MYLKQSSCFLSKKTHPKTASQQQKRNTHYYYLRQRWAKLLILVDFDVDIDNILEIDVEFDVWSDFDFGIEYCQANLQMLKLSTNLDMQLLNLEFES